MRRTFAAATGLALSISSGFAAGIAPVQIVPPPFTEPGMILPYVLNPCPNGTCPNNGPATPGRPAPGPGAAGKAAPGPTGPTSYIPDPALRERIKAEFITELGRSNPAHAQEFPKLFQGRDMIADFDRQFGPLGLKSGDAADAYAGLWVESWRVANNFTRPLSPTAVRAARVQVAAIIQQKLPQLSDPSARQAFAETMIYRTVLLSDGLRDAQQANQATNLQALSERAAHALPGMDQRELMLTEAGFKKRA